MLTFVEISVNVPQVAGLFHYHLPPELEGRVQPGHLVVAPFGKQRVQGVVLRLVAEPEVPETRAVLELLDPAPVLTAAQLALARRLSETTLSPLAACIDLMLPPGLSQMADTLFTAQPARHAADSARLSPLQARLLDLLEKRGPLRGRQIEGALPRLIWRPAMSNLVRRGLVATRSVLPPPAVQAKLVRTAQLACPPEKAEAEMASLGRAGTPALERRQSMLRFLIQERGAVDVGWVYAASGGKLADLRFLAERGLVSLGESEVWRDPLAEVSFIPADPPQLTRDQERVWSAIRVGLHEAAAGRPLKPYLLHGVTGSGKTEIYLRAVGETFSLGKQAIVLVPEIALTPQTVQRFVSRFPGRVGLVHSRLSAGERYDTWRRARRGELGVIVGPRSALFTPFPDLGLIVVDECHEDSYYQGEISPYYHAREVALEYAGLAGAVCLLGSATPDITSLYQAQQADWKYLRLPERIVAHRQAVQSQLEKLGRQGAHYRPLEREALTGDLPAVQLVDMRQELKAGNRSIFSHVLQASLAKVLEDGEQAILFLNRRGTATYVFCRECGFVLRCARCGLPLTAHKAVDRADEPPGGEPSPPLGGQLQPLPLAEREPEQPASRLVCHHCGYTRQMPARCPQCGSSRVRQYGTGTERVEAETQALFPQARILRWDTETTRHKGAHEIILSHFANHRADILVGTQMLAKGLDLPLVTLVGVVLADVGLNLPDYRAVERTFQVLTQVAGRAGRSPLGGQVVLQTFEPGHYAIQAAAQHDTVGFYRRELAFRRELGYPPFTQLVRLEYRHAREDQAESAAVQMAAQLQAWLASEDRRATQLIGPAPCFYARLGGLHRWQIILRGPDPASLLRGRALGDWRVEVNPPSLL